MTIKYYESPFHVTFSAHVAKGMAAEIDDDCMIDRDQHRCMFDSLPEKDKYKPMGLVCTCPKCSWTC